MGLFGGKSSGSDALSGAHRSQRHSSGWAQLQQYLKAHESLRILDIGPTSAGNINFITNLGHSIYMANLVEDSARPDYLIQPPDGDPSARPVYDVERYLRENLDFSGRKFDVVTLWDTADYLPEPLLQPVIDRIYDVTEPGAQLLATFHAKTTGDDVTFSRYHLTATNQLELQRIGIHPIRHTYTNRQVETLFKRFSSYKFFLAKDTLREVMVVR
jgi:hypothetical protein